MNALGIVAVAGLATVQDGGRIGHVHEGVPPGGALVPELLARANRAVGNAWSAPAIEWFGAITVEARGGPVHVATEDGIARTLRPGELWALTASRRWRGRYLAVAGGVDVPCVLGGHGTLLAASVGGLGGRMLRAGDPLPIRQDGRWRAAAGQGPPEPDLDRPIRVLAGPDSFAFERSALVTLTTSEYTIAAASDRTGTRLAGPPLARATPDEAPSAPMVCGAIQVPASGGAIVLGPDHPTTGGYPVLAVILSADRGAFFARRPGAPVRFSLVDLAEAQAAWHALRAQL